MKRRKIRREEKKKIRSSKRALVEPLNRDCKIVKLMRRS